MLAAFAAIMLGVSAREFGWDIQGLDAYAGYAIDATLFLALPGTLKHGDHIRVTLVIQRLPARAQNLLGY
jgi:TRAP-type C4-dicarboxylate transport system permease small subunit